MKVLLLYYYCTGFIELQNENTETYKKCHLEHIIKTLEITLYLANDTLVLQEFYFLSTFMNTFLHSLEVKKKMIKIL